MYVGQAVKEVFLDVARINWNKIRTEYVTTDTTYRKLAKKYNVAVTSVCNHATKENWQTLREETKAKIVTKVETKIEQKYIDKAAEKITKEIDLNLEAANQIVNLIANAFNDPKQFYRHLVKVKEGEDFSYVEKIDEQDTKVLDTKRLQELSRALREATNIQRMIKDVLEPGMKAKLEIEKQKLELEKQKLEILKEKQGLNDDDENETGIVILPEIEEGEE